MNQKWQTVSSTVLVACAVVMTGAVVYREVIATRSKTVIVRPEPPRLLEEWSQLVSQGIPLRDGESRDSICESLPDEFHEFVDKVADGLESEFTKIFHGSHQSYCDILNKMPGKSSLPKSEWRKLFASHAVKMPNYDLLFNYLDNRPVSESIWKMIRPKGE